MTIINIDLIYIYKVYQLQIYKLGCYVFSLGFNLVFAWFSLVSIPYNLFLDSFLCAKYIVMKPNIQAKARKYL